MGMEQAVCLEASLEHQALGVSPWNHKAVTRKCLWVWGQQSEERQCLEGD